MTRSPRLSGYAAFAAVLSAAGLPIYIHAPQVYAAEYGVSLGAMGGVLFALRLFDLVQDPALGWLASAVRRYQGVSVIIGGTVMGLGMLGLFAVAPPIAPIWWFALTLSLVFSAFSFLTIAFYARGIATAGALSGEGHLHLARWRETGALLGVCTASVLPTVLGAAGLPDYAGFAVIFAVAVVAAVWLMRREWGREARIASQGFGPVLRDSVALRLLVVALANAAPVAVSSTLFLFFVESRLDAPGWEGPLLLLFFLAAAGAAPVWGRIAEARGAKRTLLAAMGLAIVSFGFALTLRAGDVAAFAAICIASGAAVGADLTLLPAMFARRMARVAPEGSEGFALWSFAQKVTLAFAAIALLPLLESVGFQTGTDNSARALWTLSLLYAAVPCVLKLVAMAVLVATPIEET
ncbi:hypothetical protein ROJ8625_03138 [Roseivivax jejudonensis]|uniref:Major facilitator superfamily (MFS) profile domain-containing protein n=1 Tax=Roseivivax jejudonensis TaxID=1529041 RepID=A0A1X6ZW87_9RHOB|nr:MFS transporter [Roseivivax jejudonensis]SLN61522.1 hypothetical protein ROJ8625_03138 [Roseivivax jejudonensis]